MAIRSCCVDDRRRAGPATYPDDRGVLLVLIAPVMACDDNSQEHRYDRDHAGTRQDACHDHSGTDRCS